MENTEERNVFDNGMNINPCAGGGFTVLAYGKSVTQPEMRTFAFSNVTDLMSFLIEHARSQGMPASKGHWFGGVGVAPGVVIQPAPLGSDLWLFNNNTTTAKADIAGDEFTINAR